MLHAGAFGRSHCGVVIVHPCADVGVLMRRIRVAPPKASARPAGLLKSAWRTSTPRDESAWSLFGSRVMPIRLFFRLSAGYPMSTVQGFPTRRSQG